MQTVKMRDRYVAISKVERTEKKVTQGFVVPQALDTLGKVVFVSSAVPDLKPGDLVYYGPKSEPLRIQGQDLMVMDASNVFGVIDENQKEESQA